MKSLAILGAILAVTAASAANAKSMPQGNPAGGPIQQGEYCWIATTLEGAGFWERCNSDFVRSLRRGPNDVLTYGDGGGGGGGGNR